MKRVVLINDISGVGRCSLGVGIPILSCLGLQVSPLATAVLTNQTAYPSFYKKNVDSIFEEATKEWKQICVQAEGCITGYFTSAKQVSDAVVLYDSVKKDNSLLIVDPVMGEEGHMYSSFDKKMCDSIIKLARCADIITPNFTEACILCGLDYESLHQKDKNKKFFDMLSEAFGDFLKSCKGVAVTGIKDSSNNCIYNLLITSRGYIHIDNPIKNGTYSGTGDIFCAIMGGLAIKGYPIDRAFCVACEFLNEAIQSTRHEIDGKEGLDFECLLSKLMSF